MSVITLDTKQVKAVMKRKPYATIRDIEMQTDKVTYANNPVLLYILHVSKKEGPVEFHKEKKCSSQIWCSETGIETLVCHCRRPGRIHLLFLCEKPSDMARLDQKLC